MVISARVSNQVERHSVVVSTNGHDSTLAIPPKPQGRGSAINGGELLFLALATCYCNDIYREAAICGIEVSAVQVEVAGDFGSPGEGARNISYKAIVNANAPRDAILDLMRHTDTVAEIHNTLRGAVSVVLTECEARTV